MLANPELHAAFAGGMSFLVVRRYRPVYTDA